MRVLILVVMEDALALVFDNINIKLVGVLILVVMEDALAPTVVDSQYGNSVCVLILVVMEDALAPLPK